MPHYEDGPKDRVADLLDSIDYDGSTLQFSDAIRSFTDEELVRLAKALDERRQSNGLHRARNQR